MPKRDPEQFTNLVRNIVAELEDKVEATEPALWTLKGIANPKQILYVQNVILPPEGDHPGDALHIGYNINGRAIVAYSGPEPEHLKGTPHLLRTTSVDHSFYTLKELLREWGILYTASPQAEPSASEEAPHATSEQPGWRIRPGAYEDRASSE